VNLYFLLVNIEHNGDEPPKDSVRVAEECLIIEKGKRIVSSLKRSDEL
jgi:hypothetical protein